VRLLVLAGLVLGNTGCARLFSSYDIAPNGLARRDDVLRHLLVSGRPDSALVRVDVKGESAPEDELLRALYGGILGHYAGSYASSSAALQRAADLAEDRYTKRISRAALSLVTNDKVLPYEPGGTERLLIHYYAALNYLRQDDTAGAAVEARRLSALLERQEAPRDSALLGWLRYFSGTVFEAVGERNDADVAYRNAQALLGASAEVPGGEWPGATGAAERSLGQGARAGEVVVLIEEGFVAHRVEQAIVMPLFSFEMDRLGGGETGSRLAAAAAVTTRVLAQALVEAGSRNVYYDSRPRTLQVAPLPREVVLRECAEIVATKGATDDAGKAGGKTKDPPKQPDPAPIAGPTTVTGNAGGMRGTGAALPARSVAPRAAPQKASEPACGAERNPYLLRIAWPVFHQELPLAQRVRVVASGTTPRPAELQLSTNLTRAVVLDFEQERSAILARTILRGVTKAVVTRSVEKAPGEDAEAVGRLLGALVNLGTALLEQADTRSWQLLPNQLKLVRLQLPPGEHQLIVELQGAGGEVRQVELGAVRVVEGEMRFLSARVWH
jgi:hypothetical protein